MTSHYADLWLQPTKYLYFLQTAHTDKTATWDVMSRRHGDVLGEIKWYGPWRQYSFFPRQGCIFNRECLDDIGETLATAMRIRRNIRENLAAAQERA